MIEPVLYSVWVFLGYGEIPAPLSIVGGIIIIAGVSAKTFLADRKKTV